MKRTFGLLMMLMSLLFAGAASAQEEGLKILHGPYLQNLGEREATIVWVSNKPSVGWVEIAPADESHFYEKTRKMVYDTEIGIKKTSTIHSLKLTGLQPNTRYRYRVCVQEILKHEGHKVIYGDIVGTNVYQKKPLAFVTNDTSKKNLSFSMVNDIHGRNEILENMVKLSDPDKTDLFLFCGDMVSVSNDQEQMFSGFMDKATELFAGSTPMYYCRGNHETRGPMAPYFQNYFNTEEDELFYMFRQGPVCFVVLDCGEDKPDTDIEYYGITAYDEYRTLQAEWLKTALQSDLYRNAPFKVVVCHMPPFGGWHGEVDIAEKFVPLLNAAKPDVYLCGHLHNYIRNEAGKDGVAFPVIANSNNTLLKAEVQGNKMDIRILDLSGKETDRLVIEK